VLLSAGRHPPEPLNGQEVRLRARPAALPLPPRGRDPTTDEQCPSEPLLSPEGNLLSATQAQAKQVGTPPNDRRDIRGSLQVLPDFAPGPDEIPYSTWKQVNKINPSILLHILALLGLLGYHPASLKSSNGVVLDKPGKPSYESPSSFRIIVLIRTISKVLERIIAARLLAPAWRRGPLHPTQFGSLPGLRTYDACLTLTNDIRSLQRARLNVSSLFLDIKGGFDHVVNNTLARILREGGIPPYLVSWVSSFLGEQSCTLIFQGARGTPAPVNVGAPQGSPISPLLFLLYVAQLHFGIPRGLTSSYVDDFALTVAYLSYCGNIRQLQDLLDRLERKASRLGVCISVAKTELIHWRTPSQRHSPKCVAPIQIKGELFHPGTLLGGSGTGSLRPLTRLHTSRVTWPWTRVRSPSFIASVRPVRASPSTCPTDWQCH